MPSPAGAAASYQTLAAPSARWGDCCVCRRRQRGSAGGLHRDGDSDTLAAQPWLPIPAPSCDTERGRAGTACSRAAPHPDRSPAAKEGARCSMLDAQCTPAPPPVRGQPCPPSPRALWTPRMSFPTSRVLWGSQEGPHSCFPATPPSRIWSDPSPGERLQGRDRSGAGGPRGLETPRQWWP